jgi:hypothetical protein
MKAGAGGEALGGQEDDQAEGGDQIMARPRSERTA